MMYIYICGGLYTYNSNDSVSKNDNKRGSFNTFQYQLNRVDVLVDC